MKKHFRNKYQLKNYKSFDRNKSFAYELRIRASQKLQTTHVNAWKNAESRANDFSRLALSAPQPSFCEWILVTVWSRQMCANSSPPPSRGVLGNSGRFRFVRAHFAPRRRSWRDELQPTYASPPFEDNVGASALRLCLRLRTQKLGDLRAVISDVTCVHVTVLAWTWRRRVLVWASCCPIFWTVIF